MNRTARIDILFAMVEAEDDSTAQKSKPTRLAAKKNNHGNVTCTHGLQTVGATLDYMSELGERSPREERLQGFPGPLSCRV